MSLNADSSVCAVESFVESCVENHEFKAIGRLYSHVNILIITEPITKIGRNSSSQKHLHFAIDNSKYVSREHFEIHLIDHDFYMICKSRNGIYLDGVLMRASPEPVKLPPDTCAFRIPSTNIELVFNNWLNGIPKEDDTHPSSEVVNIESNWPKIEKPPYSYAQLIVQAIQSAPKKQLSLSAIYSFISRKYSYFRDDDSKGWQNSIRHNLSLNRYFLKIPRSSDTPGKGCLWRIDPKCEMKLAANCYRKRKNRLNTIGERNVSSTDPYTPKVSPSHVNLLVNFMENNTINNSTLNNSMLEKRDISFN